MSSRGPVMFVDDEEHVRLAAGQALDLDGFAVELHADGEAVLGRLAREWPGVLVTDVRLPGKDGLAILHEVVALDADLPVVLITGHGDISMAVAAMRDGAYDFLEKPFASQLLVDVVGRAMEKRSLVLENRALRSEISGQQGLESRVVGRTRAALRLREQIRALALTDADVLIQGETGTGKELIARSVHALSARSAGPFVALNCGALPEAMIESELFGHEKGAFTGAVARRIGKFEHANGGTVLLDEIESMPYALQVRLLRVLQEREVERLGSNEPVPLDVRVIAATKRDLRVASDAGEFREDLYYRINVATLEIPPLRERREDIALLLRHFVDEAAMRHGRESPELAPQVIEGLVAREWRGNVRELQNAAERIALGLGGPADLAPLVPTEAAGLVERLDAYERALIVGALSATGGRVKDAYEALGLPRKTFYDKLKKHGLSRSEFVDD